jgi:hypothetical protein
MKIRYSLLDRLIELTTKEMDIVLYVAIHQDDQGRLLDTYYRDICNAYHMCGQSFYSSLSALQDKGIVVYERKNQIFSIKLLDNDFSSEKSYQEGYIDLSDNIYRSCEFNYLTAKEKVLFFHLMKQTDMNSKYQIQIEMFFEEYSKLLHIQERTLKNYLYSMHTFYDICTKKKKIYISWNMLHSKELSYSREMITVLAYYRTKTGKSQKEIAEIADIPLKRYQKYESNYLQLGEEKYGAVEKIAEALGIDPGELVKNGETQVLYI